MRLRLPTIVFPLIVVFFVSCRHSHDKNVDEPVNDSITYFDNGNPKTYKKIRRDSIFDVMYYRENENGVLDSMYRFKPFQDTLLAHEQYIYNDNKSKEELNINRIETDSGQYFEFTLTRPHGEWIALYIKRNNENWKKDTLIWGEFKTSTPRQIFQKDLGDSILSGYVMDWGIFTRADTVGTIGHHVKRFVKFDHRIK